MPNSKTTKFLIHRTYTLKEIDAMGGLHKDGTINEERVYEWVDEVLSDAEIGLCEHDQGPGIESGEELPGPNYLPQEDE